MNRREMLRWACSAGAVIATPRAFAAQDKPPSLEFAAGGDFGTWQAALRNKLAEILALPTGPGVPLDAKVSAQPGADGYSMERISFVAEPGETVPGYLLRPKAAAPPHRVMICLQGHSPGMHVSLGQARKAGDNGGRDFALQAVAKGWAALVLEQRAMGERARPDVSCEHAALSALLRGRPLTGQRVFDVRRAIDFLETQPGLDLTRVGCMGNSMGGTVSLYAACIDPRIRLAVVSCSFCTFEDSWLRFRHCACGYLPGILNVADMPDLAGLIAPRRLVIVAGRKDHLALLSGVERGFRRTQAIFSAARVGEHVQLVVGEEGHQFYPEIAWPVITEGMGS